MDWMFHDYNPVTDVTTHIRVENGQVQYRRSQPVQPILDHAAALRQDETAWNHGKDRAAGINTASVPFVLYEQWWKEWRGQDKSTMEVPPCRPGDQVGMKHPDFALYVQRKVQSREFRDFMHTYKNPYPWREQEVFDLGRRR